jgi:hypothetical protein
VPSQYVRRRENASDAEEVLLHVDLSRGFFGELLGRARLERVFRLSAHTRFDPNVPATLKELPDLFTLRTTQDDQLLGKIRAALHVSEDALAPLPRQRSKGTDGKVQKALQEEEAQWLAVQYALDPAVAAAGRDRRVPWPYPYSDDAPRQGRTGFNAAVAKYLEANGIADWKQECTAAGETARAFQHQRVFDLCTRADVPISRCIVAWRTGAGKTAGMV